MIELHIITNCVQSTPDTAFINVTYKSFCDTFGFLPATVWCDPKPKEEVFDKYCENMKSMGFENINKTSSLPDAYLNIIKSCKSEFAFILEHDWLFVKSGIFHDLEQITEAMKKDRLYYFRFNKSINKIKGWDRWLDERRAPNGLKYCVSGCWSGNPHILNIPLCFKKGLVDRIKKPSYKTMERKLTDDGDLIGAIYGPAGHPPTILHLDGRSNAPKPHWTLKQVEIMSRKANAQMDKIAVCLPWSDIKCRWREKAKEFVFNHYDSFARVFWGSSTGEYFNVSMARNNAASKALLNMPACEVLFFADTDTWVTKEQVKIASALAIAENRMILAYDQYLRMDQKATDRFHRDGLLLKKGRVLPNHVSGAVAVPVTLWKELGGFDERFKSWGGDDRAFFCAAATISGYKEVLRVPGYAYHFFHPASLSKNKHLPEYQANIQLGIKYKTASGHKERMGILPETENDTPDIEAMIKLLSGNGAPLSIKKIEAKKQLRRKRRTMPGGLSHV